MKKFITIIMTLVFVAGSSQVLAQTATTSPQVNAFLEQLSILRDLRQGMSGDDVKKLQEILAAQPDIYPEGIVSGYYGPLTAKAVKKYQEKYGIPPVGQVGPMTKKKLNEVIVFNTEETTTPKRMHKDCVRIPPGHMVAPGWIKKNGGVVPQAPACQTLPPGISKKMGSTGTTSATSTPTRDRKAPIITEISVASTTATTTKVSWTTNELATTKLVYSTSSPVASSSSTTLTVDGLSLTHSVNIDDLDDETKYYFIVMSADSSGNKATSRQKSFTTLED